HSFKKKGSLVDTTTVIVMGLFALVIIVAAIRFRHHIKVGFRGPGNMGIDLDASNPLSRPGALAKKITSRRGTVTVTDETGRATEVDTVHAYKDVNISTRLPQENPPPKAPPLA